MKRLLLPLALLLPWAMLCAHLSLFWSLSPEYRFGWLVPPLAAYLFFRRWNTLPAKRSSRNRQGADLVIVLSALLFLPLWMARTATPDWSGISYALAALIIAFTLAVLARMGGWGMAWRMAFPVCFLICAIPWPQRIEMSLVQSLMQGVAAITAELAQWWGIAAEPRGNLVLMGETGVDISEACSGIRSLESLVMAALFVGELRRMFPGRRVALVGAGIGLAVLSNVARNFTLLLTLYYGGPELEGKWHDFTGWAFLLASFMGVLLIAKWLDKPRDIPESQAPKLMPLPEWMPGALVVWFLAVALGNESWYRWNERGVKSVQCLNIHWPVDREEFRRDPIPDRARSLTLCSEADHVSWKAVDGKRWSFLTLRWAPGSTAPQSARMHQPEICLKAIGAAPIRELSPVELTVPGGRIKLRPWLFRYANRPLFVFFTIWEEVDERQFGTRMTQDWSPWGRMQGALSGRRNLGQQSVEIALDGYETQEEAVAALKAGLPFLLSITAEPKIAHSPRLGTAPK